MKTRILCAALIAAALPVAAQAQSASSTAMGTTTGDASGMTVLATGASSTRTMGAISADEIIAKAAASTAFQPGQTLPSLTVSGQSTLGAIVNLSPSDTTSAAALNFSGFGSANNTKLLNSAAGQLDVYSGAVRAASFYADHIQFPVPLYAQSLILQGGGIYGSGGPIVAGSVRTVTAGTVLSPADCGGLVIFNSGSNGTINVPGGLGVMCKIDVEQAGAGAAYFATPAGETIEQFGSGTLQHATAGQYAKASILVDSSTSFLLGGQVQ